MGPQNSDTPTDRGLVRARKLKRNHLKSEDRKKSYYDSEMKRDCKTAGLGRARGEPGEKRTRRQEKERPKNKKAKRRTKLRHNEDVPAMMICFMSKDYVQAIKYDGQRPEKRPWECTQGGWLHLAIDVACRSSRAMEAEAARLWSDKLWTREENRINNDAHQHPDYPRNSEWDLGLAEYDGDDPVIYKQQQRLNHAVIWREALRRLDEEEKEEEQGVTYAERLEWLHYGWTKHQEEKQEDPYYMKIEEESWE